MGRIDHDDPNVLLAIGRLHQVGWSIADVAYRNGAGGLSWVVSGIKGENRIVAEGSTSAEAWSAATEQARSLGMLRRTN